VPHCPGHRSRSTSLCGPASRALGLPRRTAQ
jgi:hypothetical protein